MINVEWTNNGTCENCGKENPHCAQITHSDGKPPEEAAAPLIDILLCAPCVEDLKKRLS